MMAIKKENKQILSNEDFLTPDEQAVCAQVAKSKAPHGGRAAALLAVNQGRTQVQAAEEAGLSIGQVKYWVARFRKQRLTIFPDPLLNELDSSTNTQTTDPGKGKPKDKKAKKEEKAVKKSKKDKKKAKKSKKNKKKTGKAKKTKKK